MDNHPEEKQISIRKRPFAFVDLEMTGLNIEQHEIVEIGLVLAKHVADPSKKSGFRLDLISEHEWKVTPEHIETADPTALAICKYTDEGWKNALPLEDVLREFAELTDGAMMVGHNVAFDHSFIEKAFRIKGVPNKLHYHKLDTLSVALGKLFHETKLEKFSLQELTSYFHIHNEDAHSALPDTRATFELYEHLLNDV